MKNIKILEEFEGFVDKLDDKIAYITLKTSDNMILHCEYPSIEFVERGINERQIFKAQIIEEETGKKFIIKKAPVKKMSKKRSQEIDKYLDGCLGGDNDKQNDYQIIIRPPNI